MSIAYYSRFMRQDGHVFFKVDAIIYVEADTVEVEWEAKLEQVFGSQEITHIGIKAAGGLEVHQTEIVSLGSVARD